MLRFVILAATFVVASSAALADEEEKPAKAEAKNENVEFHNHNARRYYDGSRFARAREQFERALALDPTNETALHGRAWATLKSGEILIEKGQREGSARVRVAIGFFEALRGHTADRNSFKVDLGLGLAHARLGDHLAALAGRLPQSAALHKALELRKKEYDRAEKYLRAVLERSEVPAARENLTALLQLARIAVVDEEYEDALSYAERYLVQVARSKMLWVNAIAEYPENRDEWEEKLAGAVTQEVEVRDLIADVSLKLGRLDDAEEQLSCVILLSPETGDAYLSRGIVREKRRRYREAASDFRRFLALAARLELPADDPRVLDAARRLERLEKDG